MIFSSLTPWRTHPSSPLPSEKTRKEREAKMQLLVSDAYQWREDVANTDRANSKTGI
jgi:hypothetical protein